ncbi:MAG: nucleotide exchange factor GrpE [Candidatus Brocadiaceae bacterium]|nr:nucleotide exchange factor GrpE [Candidatus Brocadiaceae bacterium]
MVEKEKARSERSQGPDPESAPSRGEGEGKSSGSTAGKEEKSASGGPKGMPSVQRKPSTNQAGGEAEEGATEAVPSSALGGLPAEKGVELTEEEFAELKKKVEERDEYLDVLLRTKADFSNYQKRMKRELESMARYATQDLVKALIPAMDHLSRAIKSAGSHPPQAEGERGANSEGLRKFLDGLQLIQNEFLKALEGAGVKNVEGTVGQPFNPEFHEAFLEEEEAQLPHHTILEMLEPGFILHDRVLKPAKVKVSKKPVPQEGKPGQEAPPAKEESLPETKPDSPQAD